MDSDSSSPGRFALRIDQSRAPRSRMGDFGFFATQKRLEGVLKFALPSPVDPLCASGKECEAGESARFVDAARRGQGYKPGDRVANWIYKTSS